MRKGLIKKIIFSLILMLVFVLGIGNNFLNDPKIVKAETNTNFDDPANYGTQASREEDVKKQEEILKDLEKSESSKSKEKESTGGVMSKIYWLIGVIIYGLAYCVGILVTWMLGYLTEVAQYNNFINATAVEVGWVVVRDICNMFFVLILLAIAFGTILRRESYSMKALLPKLVIMAVLINFSKTICGLIIDFSQVIMLTFVAGFANGSAGNMVQNLGLNKTLGFGDATGSKIVNRENNMSLSMVGGLFIGLICMIVMLVVIIAMIVTLIARIVMLWIYAIMSPIAYFGAAFPAGQKYASQWWSEFSKNVIVGPVLAFFLYLAIVTASKSTDVIIGEVKVQTSLNDSFMTSFLNDKTFSTYLITLGLLIGGMMVAQSVGAQSGGAIGKGMAVLNKGKGLALKGAKTLGTNVGKAGGKMVARNSLAATGNLMSKTPWGKKEGSTTGKIANLASNWGNDMKERRMTEKRNKKQKVLEKIGMGGKAMESFEEVAKDTKVQKGFNAVKYGTAAAAAAVTGAPLVAAGMAAVAGAMVGRNKIGEKIKNWAGGEKDEKIKKIQQGRDDEIKAVDNRAKNDSDIISNNEKLKENKKNREKELLDEERKIVDENKDHYTADSLNNMVKKKQKEINDEWDAKDSSLEQENQEKMAKYQKMKDGINKHATDAEKKAVDDQGWMKRTIEKTAEEKGVKYNPLELYQKAAAEGSKEYKNAKNTRDDAKTATGEDLARKSWSGVGGPSSADKKTFDALNDGSKDAAEALKNMATELKKLAGQSKDLSSQQSSNILSLKRLLATQMDAGTSLSREMIDFKNSLNEIEKVKDSKDNYKVEDLQKEKK